MPDSLLEDLTNFPKHLESQTGYLESEDEHSAAQMPLESNDAVYAESFKIIWHLH